MSTTTQVSDLKINKMTSAQYATITPSPTELYFITDDNGITSSDITNALGYTPYNATNPSGYQANVIETVKVNGTVQTVTTKTVNLTIPAAPTVNNSNMVIQRNGTAVGTFTANQSAASTINITVPTTAADVGALPSSTVIPTVNNSNMVIQRNGTSVGTFTANQTSASTINISVPTTAADVNALPSSTTIGDGKVIFKKNGTAFATATANQTSTINIDYTIPSEVTETTVSGWGFTKNAGTVTKVNNVSPDANGNVTVSAGSTVTFRDWT